MYFKSAKFKIVQTKNAAPDNLVDGGGEAERKSGRRYIRTIVRNFPENYEVIHKRTID